LKKQESKRGLKGTSLREGLYEKEQREHQKETTVLNGNISTCTGSNPKRNQVKTREEESANIEGEIIITGSQTVKYIKGWEKRLGGKELKGNTSSAFETTPVGKLFR